MKRNLWHVRLATLLLLLLASSVKSAVSDLTSYTNTQHGFSMKFPADWVVEADRMGVIVLFGSLDPGRHNVVVISEELPPGFTLEEYAVSAQRVWESTSSKYTKEEQTTLEIAGRPGVAIIYRQAVEQWPEAIFKKKAVLVEQEGTVYTIFCTAVEDYTFSEGDIFDEVIKSFRFVAREVALPESPLSREPGQMVVYTDSTSGLSMKHPDNWNVMPGFAQNLIWFSEPVTPELLQGSGYTANVAVVEPAKIPSSLSLDDVVRKVETERQNTLPKYHRETKYDNIISSRPAVALVFTIELEKLGRSESIKGKHVFVLDDERLFIITANALEHRFDEYEALFDEMIKSFVLPAAGSGTVEGKKTVALPNWVWPIVIGLVVGGLFQFWKKKLE